jgi:anti-sigma factor RsiW
MTVNACASGVDLLMDYLEGGLPAATVASIEAHVSGCDRCQAFVASYRATPGVVRDATDVALPPAVQASLLVWLRERRGG